MRGGYHRGAECPWSRDHSTSDAASTTVVSLIDGKMGFHCMHSHCDRRDWHALTAEMEHRFPEKPPYINSHLPEITHGSMAEGFLRRNDDDFRAIYDEEGRPLAQWVGTRWDISRDDTLLQKAVKDHLKVMHDFHPKPEKGFDDRRQAL